jgi:hypothetical protein
VRVCCWRVSGKIGHILQTRHVSRRAFSVTTDTRFDSLVTFDFPNCPTIELTSLFRHPCLATHPSPSDIKLAFSKANGLLLFRCWRHAKAQCSAPRFTTLPKLGLKDLIKFPANTPPTCRHCKGYVEAVQLINLNDERGAAPGDVPNIQEAPETDCTFESSV